MKILLIVAVAVALSASTKSVRLNLCFDQIDKIRNLIVVMNQKKKYGQPYDWEVDRLRFRYFKGVEYCGADGMKGFNELFVKYGILKTAK